MIRNEEKHQLATQYRKRGFTYSEIAKICEVSPGTLSAWFSKKPFSKRVSKDNAKQAATDNRKRMRLLNKTRQTEWATRYREATRSAETEYKHYKTNPLFTAGLMLYVADGDHQASHIRLTTQSATAHRIFQKFMKEFCGLKYEEITFWLLLPSSVPSKTAEATWSRLLKRQASTFGKTQRLTAPAKTLRIGTGNTIIGNTVLKRKLDRWIELATKELAK